MTKEQFYKNCLTEEGREIIDQEFNTTETMLKGYYKRDIDLTKPKNWNIIIYIEKLGKVEKDNENYDMANYEDWEIRTFNDFLELVGSEMNEQLPKNKLFEILRQQAEKIDKTPTNYDELVDKAIKLFNSLKGEELKKYRWE